MAGVSLTGGGSGVASLGARGVSRAGTLRRAPCHLSGGMGLWGVAWRAQQYKREEKMGPYRKFPFMSLTRRAPRSVASVLARAAGTVNQSYSGNDLQGGV